MDVLPLFGHKKNENNDGDFRLHLKKRCLHSLYLGLLQINLQLDIDISIDFLCAGTAVISELKPAPSALGTKRNR